MRKQPEAGTAWTDRDSALWHTCEVAADLSSGHVPRPRQRVLAPFPPQLAADELFWAAGPYTLLEQRAVGDGTYRHDTGVFFWTGRGGLALTAGVAAAQAAGNARRRRDAQEAAVPRWVPVDSGAMFVSRYGIHLHDAHAVRAWDWPSVTAAQMVAPAALHLFAESTDGPVSWVLCSDWAELVFVAWAFARHRAHPQLVGGGWLPPGWLEWCARAPHPTRLASPALPM